MKITFIAFGLLCSSLASAQTKVVVVPLGDGQPLTSGIDFVSSSNQTSVGSLATCASRTVLKTVSLTVPASKTDSYVFCSASGATWHSQAGKTVFYSIDDNPGNGTDVFTYTSIDTLYAGGPNNYDSFALQKVYTFPPAGGSDTFYLKSCRQDTNTTGIAYHNDFVCQVFLNRF